MSMEALYALALELVAFFGFLCILFNVLLPVLAFVLRFVAVDVPREWRKWQLHQAQQHELKRLQRHVDVLTRRKQTEEQETRRRVRTSSAKKRQQIEKTPLQDEGSIADSSSMRKVESTPRQQRHRLSIHSTAKKPAASGVRERLRSREQQEF
ncbi:hypothetical protein F441_06727 [Phytophthora nicotianae CJ01A1]|uniref:Uncharacterized protein n=3 Tax=Phytophthora nicotianae TaxID=4792 RepID=W2ZJ65_PHYNI|nr:hypothetical protein L916_06535 [Phytophthora nicotianae]ETL95879.1 hypothetical protein L917_06406 [Phytophthora nicotianae]ETP19172.1 hypothetical protein F441_06727 [Phytophthora nicotianae CJ01A1]ETP47100.1 hypothetical protein F442_06760 [Phytophthora nicotianae P10297]